MAWLKTEYLHRNSNARADYLVDVLIKAPGEIAASFLIMDRRSLARPFRVRECHAGHRTALKDYENHRDHITEVAHGRWRVEAVTTNKIYAVTMLPNLHCDCDAKDNLHCRACGVCPYLLQCTCGNAARSGVSCEHMHAIMMYTNMSEQATEESLRGSEALQETPPADSAAEETSRASSEASEQLLSGGEPLLRTAQTAAQPSNDKEKRLELLRTAKISITVIEDRVKRFVKMDSNDTLDKLMGLVAQIQEVEKLALSYEEDDIRLAPRPEINRVGAKPHLTDHTFRNGECNNSMPA
ncbi:unnamed protein product [Cylicocyclus nassatus]|uniref:SWIM-type domain-containing protein n=1 Tax=Cylicocyclus nassatus TaxID=53992 RepID=A0AA36MA54_CYLNA|nr:unnamed protein product [Cylicocyclus nassatus]